MSCDAGFAKVRNVHRTSQRVNATSKKWLTETSKNNGIIRQVTAVAITQMEMIRLSCPVEKRLVNDGSPAFS